MGPFWYFWPKEDKKLNIRINFIKTIIVIIIFFTISTLRRRPRRPTRLPSSTEPIFVWPRFCWCCSWRSRARATGRRCRRRDPRSWTWLTTSAGPNVKKLFTIVIYEYCYKARVFVRLDRKSLTMTNTLAYYEILKLPTKKVL